MTPGDWIALVAAVLSPVGVVAIAYAAGAKITALTSAIEHLTERLGEQVKGQAKIQGQVLDHEIRLVKGGH